MTQDIATGWNYEILTYFTKPFDMSDLMGFIDRCSATRTRAMRMGRMSARPHFYCRAPIAAVRAEPDHGLSGNRGAALGRGVR